jgi:hypothetical protein
MTKMISLLSKRIARHDNNHPDKPFARWPVQELVRELVLGRKRANFISGKAKFAVVCGRSGENFNAD